VDEQDEDSDEGKEHRGPVDSAHERSAQERLGEHDCDDEDRDPGEDVVRVDDDQRDEPDEQHAEAQRRPQVGRPFEAHLGLHRRRGRVLDVRPRVEPLPSLVGLDLP
jgi:hypothetical protein